MGGSSVAPPWRFPSNLGRAEGHCHCFHSQKWCHVRSDRLARREDRLDPPKRRLGLRVRRELTQRRLEICVHEIDRGAELHDEDVAIERRKVDQRTIEQIGEGFQPVILPVAYQPGAKDLAQSVLCVREGAAAAKLWRQTLAQGKGGSAGASCADGMEKLTDNMTLFEMMKLTGTPVVVTASGRLYTGAGGATVQQLREALKAP